MWRPALGVPIIKMARIAGLSEQVLWALAAGYLLVWANLLGGGGGEIICYKVYLVMFFQFRVVVIDGLRWALGMSLCLQLIKYTV